MKKYIVSLAIVALALCACNRVEMHDVIADGGATVYQLDLRLGFSPRTRAISFGGDGVTVTTQFQETDCIYIYNETKGAFARTKTSEIHAPLTALHPSNVSGAFCNLSGSLSFYVWNSGLNEWTDVTIEDGDKYSLFYQMNLPSEGSSMIPLFDYSDQNGSVTSASAHDFAVATDVTMSKTATTLSAPEGVMLSNLQSMFRLRLSYTDEDSTPIAAPSIASMSVSTKNGTLVYWYKPTDTGNEYALDLIPLDTPVVFSENNDIYLSLAFHYDSTHSATDDELILSASDGTNTYKGTIAVPSSGFENSNYYYGELTMAKQEQSPSQNIEPTVIPGAGVVAVDPDEDGCYDFSASANPNPTPVSILGNSMGYYFTFSKDATITLGDSGTAVFEESSPFIFGDYGLSIILASDYTVDCRNSSYTICADWGDLTLGTVGGGVYNLTLISADPDYRGLYGDFNYDGPSCDPGVLAESGFSVELTSTTAGPDGDDDDTDPDYYTWVYTVSPNQ